MRRADIKRETGETNVRVMIDLDGSGRAEIRTGVGFLDHMLTLLARHARIDIKIEANGDLEVDAHHTTEDVGIALGQAVRQALGDKRGIRRYASIAMPMDETLADLALDISGRPFLVFNMDFPTPRVGDFDTELVREWFQAFAVNAAVTLHVNLRYGANSHHIAEAAFKGLARVLKEAVSIDPAASGEVPSTKGTLSV
jgi:imidazoleglycerol-phosphate dehydratase